jgi:hypothetical protein
MCRLRRHQAGHSLSIQGSSRQGKLPISGALTSNDRLNFPVSRLIRN